MGFSSGDISRDLFQQFQELQQQQATTGASPFSPIQQPNQGAPMNQFNVGDTVILVNHRGGSARVGDIGTVTVAGGDISDYYVDFPNQGNYHVDGRDIQLVQQKASTPKSPKAIVTFESVVLDEEKRQQIVEACEQITKRDLIFKKWGFGETIEKGKGMAMLFYGPPGTGKTLMGQALADKFKAKLKVISTADIETSEPGGAERAIRKAFADCGKDDILLFDECDSLIFSRQNAGPILGAQINQLLTSIEKHDGVTIFTTNRLGVLDEAVNRRIGLKLEFAMPSREQRAEIFKRMIPKKAPIADDVDYLRLATVEMTGGYVKNAVLRAARMAAAEKDVPDAKKQITMKHFIKAVRLEAESMAEFEALKEEENKRGTPYGIGRAVGGLQKVRG